MVHRRRRFSHIADLQCRTVSPISIAVLQCRRFSPSPLFTLRIFISSRNTFTNPNSLYRDFISFCFFVASHFQVYLSLNLLLQVLFLCWFLICDSSICSICDSSTCSICDSSSSDSSISSDLWFSWFVYTVLFLLSSYDYRL